MGATKLGQSIDAFPEIDRLDGYKNPHMRGEGNHDFVAQNVFPNSTKSKQETPFACILITEPSLFIISMVDSIKETDGAGKFHEWGRKIIGCAGICVLGFVDLFFQRRVIDP